MEKLKIKIGHGAWLEGNNNDYALEIGVIQKCCDGVYRVKFDNIGNNELLTSFDLERCHIFVSSKK